MAQIIQWQYEMLVQVWQLMTSTWILSAIPVSIILIMVINMIKGSINR